MYLVPPRGRGGYKASAGFCNVQFWGCAVYPAYEGPLVYYAALLPVGLAYVTAAYAYGKPMQAQNKQFKRDDLLRQATQDCQR